MRNPRNPDDWPDPRGVDVAPMAGTAPHDEDPNGSPGHGDDEAVHRIYPDDPTGRDPI